MNYLCLNSFKEYHQGDKTVEEEETLQMEIEEGVMEVEAILEVIEMKIVLMKMMINFQEIKGKHIIEEIRIIMVIRNKQKIKKIIINKIKINIKSHKLQTSKMMKKNNLLILMKNQKIKLIITKIIFKVNLATIKFNKINSKIHTLDFRI